MRYWTDDFCNDSFYDTWVYQLLMGTSQIKKGNQFINLIFSIEKQ